VREVDVDWWIEYRIKQEAFQAEADNRRLLAAAERAQPARISTTDRALAALGRKLSRWGERLQAHAPQHASRREALA
jgi:hypothetical protein